AWLLTVRTDRRARLEGRPAKCSRPARKFQKTPHPQLTKPTKSILSVLSVTRIGSFRILATWTLRESCHLKVRLSVTNSAWVGCESLHHSDSRSIRRTGLEARRRTSRHFDSAARRELPTRLR